MFVTGTRDSEKAVTEAARAEGKDQRGCYQSGGGGLYRHRNTTQAVYGGGADAGRDAKSGSELQ